MTEYWAIVSKSPYGYFLTLSLPFPKQLVCVHRLWKIEVYIKFAEDNVQLLGTAIINDENTLFPVPISIPIPINVDTTLFEQLNKQISITISKECIEEVNVEYGGKYECYNCAIEVKTTQAGGVMILNNNIPVGIVSYSKDSMIICPGENNTCTVNSKWTNCTVCKKNIINQNMTGTPYNGIIRIYDKYNGCLEYEAELYIAEVVEQEQTQV